MASEDGGPAFPNPMCADPHLPQSRYIEPNDKGMSLRDYFAAKAMQGILAGKASCPELWRDEMPDVTARQAYEHADFMLAAQKEAADGNRD